MASPEVQAIIDAVAAATTVDQSAVTLIQQLKGIVDANAGDLAGIGAAVTELLGDNQALTDAVTANTPAAPPAP